VDLLEQYSLESEIEEYRDDRSNEPSHRSFVKKLNGELCRRCTDKSLLDDVTEAEKHDTANEGYSDGPERRRRATWNGRVNCWAGRWWDGPGMLFRDAWHVYSLIER